MKTNLDNKTYEAPRCVFTTKDKAIDACPVISAFYLESVSVREIQYGKHNGVLGTECSYEYRVIPDSELKGSADGIIYRFECPTGFVLNERERIYKFRFKSQMVEAYEKLCSSHGIKKIVYHGIFKRCEFIPSRLMSRRTGKTYKYWDYNNGGYEYSTDEIWKSVYSLATYLDEEKYVIILKLQ